MNFNEYQKETRATAIYPKEKALEYLALGIASEAGEVAGKVKKLIRDNDGVFTEQNADSLVGELGDVLWYLAQLAELSGKELESVAIRNIQKLRSRHERGAICGSGDSR